MTNGAGPHWHGLRTEANRFSKRTEDQMVKESTAFSTIRTPSSYPASQKRYLSGACADVRVPYREIALSATRHGERVEENPPLPVYDTSGPYTDADQRIDLSRDRPASRSHWITRPGAAGLLASPR